MKKSLSSIEIGNLLSGLKKIHWEFSEQMSDISARQQALVRDVRGILEKKHIAKVLAQLRHTDNHYEQA